MSIDVLPFSAFALETCAAPAAVPGDGQTLTLALRIGRSVEPMAGRLSLQVLQAAAPGTERVGIVRAAAAPLTITLR